MDEYVIEIFNKSVALKSGSSGENIFHLKITENKKMPTSIFFNRHCKLARWHHGNSAILCYYLYHVSGVAKMFEITDPERSPPSVTSRHSRCPVGTEFLRTLFSVENTIFDNFHPYDARIHDEKIKGIYLAVMHYLCLLARLMQMKNVVRRKYTRFFDFVLNILTVELGAELYVQNHVQHKLIADHPEIPRSVMQKYEPAVNLDTARILFNVKKCGDRLWRLRRIE